MSVYEKKAEYGGVLAHIRIPEEPTGLMFIAPGAQVNVSDDIIAYTQQAAEDKGLATVVAALGGVPLNTSDVTNVHKNFTSALQGVVDGYMADNDYTPDEFEMVGHSMGGSAVFQIAAENPVSRITTLDPMSVSEETLKTIHCPTEIVVSSVRSCKNIGKRIHSDLQMNGHNAGLHHIETSETRSEGHMFLGQEQQIAAIIQGQDIIGEPSYDADRPSTDQELFGAINPDDNAPEA